MDEVAATSIRCAEHLTLPCRSTGVDPPFQETTESLRRGAFRREALQWGRGDDRICFVVFYGF